MSRKKRGRHAAPKVRRKVAVPGVALGVAAVLALAPVAQADTWGPDVSRWQGNINLSGAGDFVIMKVGGSDIGRQYKDPQLDNTLSKVRALGKQAGYYWYNGYGSATEDAKAFVSYLAGRYRCGEPVAYDSEESRFISPAKTHEFLTEVSNLLGWDCVNRYTYMSSSVSKSYNWSSVATISKLWVANYGTNNGAYQYSPSVGYWPSWNIHQYTSVGRISSYSGSIDLNRARTGAWTTTSGQTSTTATVSATNSWGYSVAQIQRLLNANGAALVVDGIQGSRTTAAVKAFQAGHGLAVDGIVGPVTWAALNSTSSATSAQSRAVAIQAAVGAARDGIIGADTTKRVNAVRSASRWGGVRFPWGVRYAQRVVGTPVDGIWGRNSRAAHDATVRAIQRALGVAADGIWGTRTEAAWQAIR